MISYSDTARRSRGFSLLEVMIAVVILATGLLALAALQGSLTRSSADAKVRGRVAAMLSARMDELRSSGYGTLVDTPIPPVPTTSTTDPCNDNDATDWIDCTRVQAGLGSLSVTSTVATWAGTTTFVTPATPAPRDPQFKRLTLTASWSDATGNAHQLAMASDISSLALTNNIILPPDDQTVGVGGPIVRTADPATAGVIPIAMGSASESATSNPTPELVGQKNNQQIVGTKFTVLNYTPPANSAVVIQKRFENQVIKCSCQYGAGGTNLPQIYRIAQWPAIWTGKRYDLYQPSSAISAPGQGFSSGPKSGVEQSPLCQECCRDHHDAGATGVAKFDPERSDGSVSKFDLNGSGVLVQANNTANATYVDACRVIRVDGFWRTAADMYSRQLGLLETETVGGVAAKTGLPTTNATAAYTSFVKNYLKQYNGSVATAPTNAQSMFDSTVGNVPSLVTIGAVSNSDYRYLHARGLYVDYLEDKARSRLADVIADNGPQGQCPTGSNVEGCVLPNLPFTTANLTEIAKWVASNPSVLTVNSGNLLASVPAQPSGSRTIGKAVGTSDNTASIRKSNSGVAVNAVLSTLNGVDPTDNSDVASDAQPFQVGGTVNSGATFDVRVSGGGANPFVWFTISTDVDTECLKPAGGDNHCVTSSSVLLPQAGSIRVGNYWVETTTSRSVTATCGGRSATDTVAVPTFRNYQVAAASIGGVNGSIVTPSANEGLTTETTTIGFSSITAGGLILVTLTEQSGSPTYATIASCTTNGGGTKINNIVWNKPWIP